MKPQQAALTKSSETEKVDAYMQGLTHPLAKVVEALRKIILSSDREIGEEIKWNAPTYFYSGEMKPFNHGTSFERYCVRSLLGPSR
jgi:hypothetical protein